MISAGELNQRVTLQRRTTGSAGFGQRSENWESFATVWAKVAPLYGRDFAAADQVQVTVDAKFVIRFRDDLSGDIRLMWRGQPYELIGEPVDVNGAKQILELRCTKGVRDGR